MKLKVFQTFISWLSEAKNKTRLIAQTGFKICCTATIHSYLAWACVWKGWCVVLFFILV